ncbi:MAG: SDH family Clp fold serine proteinase [Candidatus Nanoarchaeia archaeon]
MTNATIITDIISQLNQSGQTIPITVTTTTTTNWPQFTVSIIFSSLMIFWFFGSVFSEKMKEGNTSLLLKLLKMKTKKHILMIKHTQQDLFGGSMINQETLRKISKALHKFKGEDFDLILHTSGGDIFSSLFISRIFKDYPGKIRTIIPMYAMSGGTLLTLSTDEVYMAPTACLGPVDPQLGTLFKFGSARSWDRILKFKGKKADDSSISMAFTGAQYTKTINNYLNEIIDFGMSDKDRKKFIKFLTEGNVEHAFALTPRELKKFNFPVRKIPSKIFQKLIKLVGNISAEGVTYTIKK